MIKKEETFESHRPMELCGEKPNSDRSRHLWQIPVVRDVFWIALAATVLYSRRTLPARYFNSDSDRARISLPF